MTDIVDELRNGPYMDMEDLVNRAADEIDRLRAALREIADMIPHATPDYSHRVWTIARAALGEKA